VGERLGSWRTTKKSARGALWLPAFIKTKGCEMMFFDYDYTFCRSEVCINTECKRHRSKMPKGVPISISDFTQVCEEILVDIADDKDE